MWCPARIAIECKCNEMWSADACLDRAIVSMRYTAAGRKTIFKDIRKKQTVVLTTLALAALARFAWAFLCSLSFIFNRFRLLFFSPGNHFLILPGLSISLSVSLPSERSCFNSWWPLQNFRSQERVTASHFQSFRAFLHWHTLEALTYLTLDDLSPSSRGPKDLLLKSSTKYCPTHTLYSPVYTKHTTSSWCRFSCKFFQELSLSYWSYLLYKAVSLRQRVQRPIRVSRGPEGGLLPGFKSEQTSNWDTTGDRPGLDMIPVEMYSKIAAIDWPTVRLDTIRPLLTF